MEAKEYIYFEELAWPGRQTDRWGVFNYRSDYMIGEIKWFASWRQYCFYPTNDTIFNPDCLEYIAAKCRELTKEHSTKLNAAKRA